MSMDAAVARMPKCPICEKRIDENDRHTHYTIIDGVWYHSHCAKEEGIA